jgi:hypothetical protein
LAQFLGPSGPGPSRMLADGADLSTENADSLTNDFAPAAQS